MLFMINKIERPTRRYAISLIICHTSHQRTNVAQGRF